MKLLLLSFCTLFACGLQATKPTNTAAGSCDLKPLALKVGPETSSANSLGWTISFTGSTEPDFQVRITSSEHKSCDYPASLVTGAYFAPGKLLLLEGYSGSNTYFYFVDPLTCKETHKALSGGEGKVMGNEIRTTFDCDEGHCKKTKVYTLDGKCKPALDHVERSPKL